MMSLPYVWEFLTRYKEVITNGLDLLSFVLVTPELLRIAMPTFRRATISVVVMAEYVVIGLFIWATWGATENVTTSVTLRVLIVYAGIGLLVMPVLLVMIFSMFKTMEVFARNVLAIGISLFFASRLIALAVATHELLEPAKATTLS